MMVRPLIAALTAIALVGCSTPTLEARLAATTEALSMTEVASTSTSRVRDISVPSAALKRKVSVRVVLPNGYATQPTRRWPVLYLLHGCCTSYKSWSTEVILSLSASFGVLVVMPEGGTAGYYSNWNKGPKWETFHQTELRRYLVSNYRADSRREAIGGFSMGGFGALSYAARHPGRFKAVMALSPVANSWRNPDVVFADIRAMYPKTNRYDLWGSPKKSAKTWKKHDPYYLTKGLRKTLVYLYAGTGRDSIEPTLRTQTIRLAKKLKKQGLSKYQIKLISRTSTYGIHTNPYRDRELRLAWPHLMKALGA